MTSSFTILLMAAIQCINVLDFMMVMPLGPDLASSLDIPLSHLGVVGGSYTLSAFVAGILGSFVLDRFDRRRALLVAMFGLSLSTLAGAFSLGFYTLLLSRMAAGFFGGPASSLVLSVVSDVSKPEDRGRAMGTVMASFGLASTLGIPFGLELARTGGWRLPFLCLGGLALLVWMIVFFTMPSLTAHLNFKKSSTFFSPEVLAPKYFLAFSLFAFSIFASFLIIPNFSAYLQMNLHLPRKDLGWLYLVGGGLTLVSAKLGGIWADRMGVTAPALLGTVIFSFCLFAGFLFLPVAVSTVAIFITFMLGSHMRMVAFSTLTSKVPTPEFRARFMSMQSAVQHLMSSSGAFCAAAVLTTDSEGALVGMRGIAILALILVWASFGLAVLLNSKLKN